MIIVGYAIWGLLWSSCRADRQPRRRRSAIAFGLGIANMVFVIPSQTLFQERTPADSWVASSASGSRSSSAR